MVAISHSEDMHTGFKIADFGYKVRKAWWSTRMTTRQPTPAVFQEKETSRQYIWL